MNALLAAALEHAKHRPVFPVWGIRDGRCACRGYSCETPAKHPIASCAPEGLKNATTDETTIAKWWTDFPHANVAGPTGTVSTVLDVDPGKGGRIALAALEAQYGPLPVTAKVLTGGGGEHYHFRPVPGLRNSAGMIGPGLDVRGEGGYVVLPPSSHISGGTYGDDPNAPLYETPLADMPSWLVALASADSRNGSHTEARAPEDWAARLAGAPEGQRRAVACELAGHFLGLLGHHRAAEVEEILLGFAARCTPPFPERELLELVRDLARRDARRTFTPGPGHQPGTGRPQDGEDDLGTPSVPRIDVTNQDLVPLAAASWQALVVTNDPARLFRFGSGLARVERAPDGAATLAPLSADRLRFELARVAEWFVERRKGSRAVAPPMVLVHDMLARPDPPLPPLRRVVAAPVFAADGQLELQPGYAASAQVYFAPLACVPSACLRTRRRNRSGPLRTCSYTISSETSLLRQAATARAASRRSCCPRCAS